MEYASSDTLDEYEEGKDSDIEIASCSYHSRQITGAASNRKRQLMIGGFQRQSSLKQYFFVLKLLSVSFCRISFGGGGISFFLSAPESDSPA